METYLSSIGKERYWLPLEIFLKKFTWSLLLGRLFQMQTQVTTLPLWSAPCWLTLVCQIVPIFTYVLSSNDHSLFVCFFKKKHYTNLISILVYVDDTVLTENNNEEITHITNQLHQHFKIKDLGDITFFMGLEVARNNVDIHLSQRKYTLNLLQ